MTGIYKITNLTNGKIYIGQAIYIERRLSEHKRGKGLSTQLIDKAILKYGVENFSFEVIEECDAIELNDKEIYWIDYYNSYRRGYNLTSGGQGASNVKIRLSAQDIEDIYFLLLDYELTQNEIAKKFNVSYQTISDINRGKTRVLKGYTFPLRPSNIQHIKSEKLKQDIEKNKTRKQSPRKKIIKYCACGKQIDEKSTQCSDCYALSCRKVERPGAIQLATEIIAMGFCAVGRKYGVSDNAIRKWCISYGIPKTKKELIEWLSKQ